MGQSIQEALRGLPFVEEMEPSRVERLAAMAKEVGFQKDQVVFREGDTGKQFDIVLSGKVALEITTHRGASEPELWSVCGRLCSTALRFRKPARRIPCLATG